MDVYIKLKILKLTVLQADASNQILEGPRDATVLAGSEARFNCTVSPGWQLLMWTLNGVVVLSLTPSEVIVTNERFTEQSYPVGAGGGNISELTIHSVQLGDAGQVSCSLQGNGQSSTAVLSVQAVGTLSIPKTGPVLRNQPCNVTCNASGWTPLPELSWELEIPAVNSSYSNVLEPNNPNSTSSVLTLVPQDSGPVTCVARMRGLSEPRSVTANLTVVSSLGGSGPGPALPTWAIVLLAVSLTLLLILIITLVVIFCCYYPRRREKKAWSYQSEVRKPADVKPSSTSDVKTRGGEENSGYISDERQTHSERAGGQRQDPPRRHSREEITAALPVKSSEPSVTEDKSSTQPQQVSGHHQTRPGSRTRVSFAVASPRTVRNATLV
ncbi:immunoglobulin superfamily member 5 [Sorex araneus]|uniref:immunoglobulin superfamily member 5 n=1 Tax=Sorex araneus TaxID=42254 RepID=UPI002433B4AA|nr:immunoglobulin superfamily member 5 [Sorex araneus]